MIISGGINGRFVFAATSLTPSADTSTTGVFHYTADIVVKTAVGGLSLKDAGAVDPQPGSTGDVAAVSAVVGGSGRYASATGRIRLMGTFDTELGGENVYEGQICTR